MRVKITMTGTQKQTGLDPTTTEFVTYGEILRYGPKLRISYQESDLIGTPGVTSAFVIVGERLFLERTGKIQARMEFIAGESTDCMYALEDATFIMTVRTRRVTVDMTDSGGEIYVEYGIELNRQFVSLNKIHVTVESTVQAEETE